MEHWTQSSRNELYVNIYNQCVNAEDNFFLIGVIDEQTRVARYVVIPNNQITAKNQRNIIMQIYTNTIDGFFAGFDDLIENSFYNLVVYEQTNNTNTSQTDAVVLGLRWEGTMIIDADSEVTFTEYANPTARNYVYYNTED